MRRAAAVLLALTGLLVITGAAGARVLRVGSFHGVRGQYRAVQGRGRRRPARRLDPGRSGDYKDQRRTAPQRSGRRSGRHSDDHPERQPARHEPEHGGDRRQPARLARCSNQPAAQNFGPVSAKGRVGLNGIMVYKAANVWVQNLTVCKFLGGPGGDTGNEIWWNGGDGSGRIGGHGYFGSYLSTTSTYFRSEANAATYGVFSSNWTGGTWDQIYASNFNDSGFYIGACQQVCDQTINHGWAEFNALGYSGTNSGGRLLVEHSQFDQNEDGFDTNSQNADEPSPQNGACPAGVKPPIAGAKTCWVFADNYVHDNNNPNVPSAGSAAAGPVGTGMSLSGARNDTVLNNTFARNNAWGVILVPYPDSNQKPCTGGMPGALGGQYCLFDESNLAVVGNKFQDNGAYGQPSNGDFAQVSLEAGARDCYLANSEIGGGSLKAPSAAAAQAKGTPCDGTQVPATSTDPAFFNQVLCDTQFLLSACAKPDPYPLRTRVVMHPLPTGLPSMPNPCAGVPVNPWCPRRRGSGGSAASPY